MFLPLCLFGIAARAQTYTVLHAFSGTDGSAPNGLLASSGTLFGTTASGGPQYNYGTVFSISESGTGFNLLSAFSEGGLMAPEAGLALVSGSLYGTTEYGGGSGTVFDINPNGTGLNVVMGFEVFGEGTGGYPLAPVTFSHGMIYGTTMNGYPTPPPVVDPGGTTIGTGQNPASIGVVFSMNPDGTNYNVIHFFNDGDNSSTNGALPASGVVASGSALYGTASFGGNNYFIMRTFTMTTVGVVYTLNTDGSGYNVLHYFSGWDGANPTAGLVLSGSTLYGTTSKGGGTSGSVGSGVVFSINTDGSGFTVIHTFSGTDGANPNAGTLVLSGSTLYGMTSSGGKGNGVIYCVNTDGSGFAYYSPFSAGNGMSPGAGLTLDSGTFYGTTASGGPGSAGVIFALVPPPAPVITSALACSGSSNKPFAAYQITGSNQPTGFSATGLPSGLSVDPLAGIISGTPSATGTFNVALVATNIGGSGTAPLVMTITPPPQPPVISSSTFISGVIGMPFTFQVVASNNPNSFTATSLPGGLGIDHGTGLISGTPSVTGTFNANIGATNSSGTSSAALTIVVQTTPYLSWLNSKFTPQQITNANISGDSATPAGDGITNLMKYALGLNPMLPATTTLPVLGTAIDSSNNSYLTLTYTQAISATDISYYVEVSSDMQKWSSGTGYTSMVSVSNNPDGVTQTVVVQDLTPVSSAVKRFIRLKVTRP